MLPKSPLKLFFLVLSAGLISTIAAWKWVPEPNMDDILPEMHKNDWQLPMVKNNSEIKALYQKLQKTAIWGEDNVQSTGKKSRVSQARQQANWTFVGISEEQGKRYMLAMNAKDKKITRHHPDDNPALQDGSQLITVHDNSIIILQEQETETKELKLYQ
ncbi:hypothetical protein QUF61_12245 [Candidatus Venteria ishoeyi]|uniref:hypothetical protein n=1 Tax=Candidatus Venteria ishoeyi TaxID=1899563 RepID=UPI0025A63535|nr:hypothetical protein [Candidatus Venteria ishoeyi]MDM8547258.1 hypothetical protein [Candidatus Venteria ishoeyi]